MSVYAARPANQTCRRVFVSSMPEIIIGQITAKHNGNRNAWVHVWIVSVTIHGQCQLVKNVENRINGPNIGIKGHFGMDPETNGMVKAIC